MLSGKLAIQSGAPNWVWVVENLTLSFFTGIQKEGQRSHLHVSAIVTFCSLVTSFPWRRSEGKLENPSALTLQLPWWPYSLRKFIHKNLKEKVFTEKYIKNKSCKGDLWNRAATLLKGALVPPFLRWRQQLLQANCHAKVRQNKKNHRPL